MTGEKPAARFHSDPDCSESLVPFWQRVAETIAWCEPLVDRNSPRTCLRHEAVIGQPFERSYHACVSNVAALRQLALSPKRPPPSKDLASGRFMLYFPDTDLFDGAAELVNEGFFDVHNTPPSSTWVAFVSEHNAPAWHGSGYLIARVPPAFIELAHAGIVVNPEQCITWLDETDVLFAELVR